jgi:hypothetical protein
VKIDKEKLEALLGLSDDALWAEIVRLGKGYGFTLPEKTPPKDQLDKLRKTAGTNKINAVEAMKIIGAIRKGQNNG